VSLLFLLLPRPRLSALLIVHLFVCANVKTANRRKQWNARSTSLYGLLEYKPTNSKGDMTKQ
jgi:hypothetical protein